MLATFWNTRTQTTSFGSFANPRTETSQWSNPALPSNWSPDSRPITCFRTNSTLAFRSFLHASPTYSVLSAPARQLNITVTFVAQPSPNFESGSGAQFASNPQWQTFFRTWRATTTSDTTTIEIGTQCALFSLSTFTNAIPTNELSMCDHRTSDGLGLYSSVITHCARRRRTFTF